MQHFNLINEDWTIYDSLAFINNNFQTLLSNSAGSTAPVADSNSPLLTGMMWYNTSDNKVYQLGNKSNTDWRLVADLNGTATTKEYLDARIRDHKHDSDYLKIGAPAVDVVSVNGQPANTVLYKSNISDKSGTSSATIAPSTRLFNQLRLEVDAFVTTLGDADAVSKRLQDLFDLIDANKGALDKLQITNIQGLKAALDSKMAKTKTLEQLGGVRADGATPNGFTGRIVFTNMGSGNGGSIAVAKKGKTPVVAVGIRGDDAVQFGQHSSSSYLNAKDANSAFVSTGANVNHVIWHKGNINELTTQLVSKGFKLTAKLDTDYLKVKGKAADSSKLNGAVENVASVANTIVKRDGNKIATADYFKTIGNAGVQADAKYFLVQNNIKGVSGSHAKPVSAANVKAALGLSKLPNWSGTEMDARFFNVAGDRVKGDTVFEKDLTARNFKVVDLPPIKMGESGVTDEYMILMPAHTDKTTKASAISGRFQFQRGDGASPNALASCAVMLSSSRSGYILDLFDAFGADIFTSIDFVTYKGKKYYAAKCATTGGAPSIWEFHGIVVNEENDANMLKVVRASSSDFSVQKQRWVPADQINTFNLNTFVDSTYLRLDGKNPMTGDLKLGNKKSVIISGEGGVGRNAGKHIFWVGSDGKPSLAGGDASADIILGANNGSTLRTKNIELQASIYNKGSKAKLIDAVTGAIYDNGSRVYSDRNKSTIAFKNAAATISQAWVFSKKVTHQDVVDFGKNSSKKDLISARWDVAGSLGKFLLAPKDAGNNFGYDASKKQWFFDKDVLVGGQKVWHAGNDGSGSGLDADRVDGVQASQFLRSDTTDTATGALTFAGNTTFTKLLKHSGSDSSVTRYFTKLAASKTVLAQIMGPDGKTLKENAVYKIQMGCPGTGTSISSSAYMWHDGTWKVTNYGSGSRTSNYPWVVINGGQPKITSAHNDKYTYNIVAEEILGTVGGRKGKGSIFGAHGLFSADGTNVFVNGGSGDASRNKLWHAGNDGSGSGLDADKLDGVQGSQFLRSDATDTASGALTFTGGIHVSTAGGVGTRFGSTKHKTLVGVSSTAGEYLFGGSSTGATSFETYLRMSKTKLEFNANKVWHAGNDGAKSGLDADKLDGLEGASFLRVDGFDKTPGVDADKQGNMKVDFSYKNKAPHTGPLIRLGVSNHDIQFSSEYASSNLSFRAHNGDKKTWSPWAKIWTSENDGSGSGLDADKLRGKTLSSSSYSKDTIPLRDGSGDITARLMRSNYQNEAVLKGAIAFRVSTTDNFIRFCNDAASVRAWLGVPATSAVLAKTGKAADADKLDGINSSSFLRSDQDDTFSGDLISGSRNKGIFGVYDSKKTDQIWSMGTAYRNDAAGANFGTLYGLAYKHTTNKTNGNMAGGHQMVWCSNGTPKSAMGDGIWSAGNVTAYSDRRVKKDLNKIDDALSKVSMLNGYTYLRTDVEPEENQPLHNPENRFAGVIAQEVLEVLPEAVTGGPTENDPDAHYSVAYGNLTALLIEAVKELKQEVEELKANGYSVH